MTQQAQRRIKQNERKRFINKVKSVGYMIAVLSIPFIMTLIFK